MSDSTTADAAATTDWRTYDGPVAPQFIFHVVFFPLLMAICIMLPTALCYFCLCRSRPVPYSSPNSPGMGTTSFTSRSGGGGGAFTASPMRPSSVSSSSSLRSSKLVKFPNVAAPAAASESTLVAPSSAGLEKHRASQKSPVLTDFPDPPPVDSLVSPGSRVSRKASESASFEESPILKSFSPLFSLLSDTNVPLTAIFCCCCTDRKGPYQGSVNHGSVAER